MKLMKSEKWEITTNIILSKKKKKKSFVAINKIKWSLNTD